jgi:rhodanese-related sulfurtransferase
METTDVTGGFSVESRMEDLLAGLPGAKRALFARYHLGGCQSCGFSPNETLAGLCARNDIDADEALAHLLESERHDRAMRVEAKTAAATMRGEGWRWIDLRTREEYEAVPLPGAELFTQELQQEIFAGGADQRIVLFDHTGRGVLDQVAWFRGHGLKETYGLEGGIDAWSREVDPAVRRYRVEME